MLISHRPRRTSIAVAVVASAAVSALALSGSLASAQVQYNLQKADSYDLSTLFTSTSGYGSNPLSVAVDNAGNAYVGGYNGLGTTQNVGIVKVSGALTGAGSAAGLASTQFSSPSSRGLDSLSSFGGDIYAQHDAGVNADSFIERLTNTGATVWQTKNPGQLPITSNGSRVSAMAIDPGFTGGTTGPEVGFLAFGQGRRASLKLSDGTIDYTFTGGTNPGAIINAAPVILNNSNYRTLGFDSKGNVVTGLENGFGAGVRVSDNQFTTLDGATASAVSRVVNKSAGVFNVGNGITYLEGAATDELIAFSPRADSPGNGTTITLTAGTGEVQSNVNTKSVQIRQTRGQLGYLSQTQLTGAEDGLGSVYNGEVKNFATGVDANGNPALYVVDYVTRQLDVYTIEPRFVAAGDSTWSSPSTWTLGIVPDSRTTNATFVDAAAPRTVTLDTNRTVKQLKFGGANAFTVAGTSTLNLTAPANDGLFAYVTVLSGNHTVNAPIVLGSNTRIDVTNAADSITLGTVDGSSQNLVKRLPGTANVTHVRVNALSIDEGTLALKLNGTEAGISRVTSLTLGTTPTSGSPTTGTLNLGNNGLIIDYDAATGTSQAGNFTAAIGLGIVTSAPIDANHILGIIDYTDSPTAALPTFSAGSGLTIDRSSTFIRYTFKGDSNLSGGVNFDDLLTLAKNYGKASGAQFATGDSDGNGTVDFTDLLALAKNYSKSVGTNGAADAFAAAADPIAFAADWTLAQSLVPEPTTLLGVAGACLSMLGRRRRA